MQLTYDHLRKSCLYLIHNNKFRDITVKQNIRLILVTAIDLLKTKGVSVHESPGAVVIHILWTTIKKLIVDTEKDFLTISALLCILLSSSDEDYTCKLLFTWLGDVPLFWSLLRILTNSRNSLIRKRAIFILESFIRCSKEIEGKSEVENLAINAQRSRGSFWSDYLTVYAQLEGCMSLHLVQQVQNQ